MAIALRWSLQLGLGVVVGTTNPKHMMSDLAARHAPLLDNEEIKALSALHAAVPSVRILDGWPDVMMPTVALGSWGGSIRNGSVAEAVGAWLRAGGRHIDTAHDYATEGGVGTAVTSAIRSNVLARDELFLTTKIPGPIGYTATKVRSPHISRASSTFSRLLTPPRADRIYTATKVMIEQQAVPRLGGAPIDLVLIHWPCPGAISPYLPCLLHLLSPSDSSSSLGHAQATGTAPTGPTAATARLPPASRNGWTRGVLSRSSKQRVSSMTFHDLP